MLIKPRPLRGIVEMGEIYKNNKYPPGTTEDYINAKEVEYTVTGSWSSLANPA